MFKFVKDFQPRDLVALLTILLVIAYKLAGENSEFDSLVMLIIGYYFGKRDEPVIRLTAKK